MYDKLIENMEHFKYLGEMITNSGNSKIEIRIRLATAVSALEKWKRSSVAEISNSNLNLDYTTH